MSTKILTNIDMTGQEIQDLHLQELASDPTDATSRIYYNTTDNVVKVYNGTAWVAVGSLDNPLLYKGVIDASTNPDYPAADAGFLYVVSVAGKVGGVSGIDVEVGDWILCNTDGSVSGDQATVGANWDIVQANLLPASETDAGYIEIATQAETDAGTDDARAVTPLKLTTFVANQNIPKKFVDTFGDGALKTFTINHNLETRDAVVEIRQTATPYELVLAAVEFTDANNITISVTGPAPTLDEYTVTVIG